METNTYLQIKQVIEYGDGSYSSHNVEHTFKEDVLLDDMVYRFEEFLRGLGYNFEELVCVRSTDIKI